MTTPATKALEDAVRQGLPLPADVDVDGSRIERELGARGFVIRSSKDRPPRDESEQAERFFLVLLAGVGTFIVVIAILAIIAGALGLFR